jgi:beta-lactamase regulating signal transducer with metallopeptidase domain
VLPAKAGTAVLGARPRLALPEDFKSRYAAQERRLFLAHEAIHLRRGNSLANLEMSVFLIIQWFNPLPHWAWRAMCRDQESVCDAGVIKRHREALSLCGCAAEIPSRHPR